MKFHVQIDCGNAAFHDASGSGDEDEGANDESACAEELARVLAGAQKTVRSNRMTGLDYPLFDTNGNRVGRVWTTGKL